MPSSVVTLRKPNSRRPPSHTNGSIAVIFIEAPFQQSGPTVLRGRIVPNLAGAAGPPCKGARGRIRSPLP